jgi:molecular chaperone DnaK
MLGGDVRDMTLLDVTNFSLGIETEGRRFARLIPKGTPVPAMRSQKVSTVVDDQRSVKIHVLQGEEDLAKDNISLGEFELTDIAPGRRGMPRIEVSFTINTDGIVKVSATDSATGAKQGIDIHSPSAMSPQEIDDARQELEGFETSDGTTREVEAIRHQVEKELYSLESFLREHKIQLSKREIFDSEQALKRGRMALIKRADIPALEELLEYLVNYLGHLEQRAASAGSGEASA